MFSSQYFLPGFCLTPNRFGMKFWFWFEIKNFLEEIFFCLRLEVCDSKSEVAAWLKSHSAFFLVPKGAEITFYLQLLGRNNNYSLISSSITAVSCNDSSNSPDRLNARHKATLL